jgi:predicted RNase H-like HicB family nuclease
MSKTYEVRVTRDERWWLVSVPELEVVTQARRLADVQHRAQDVIATWLDLGDPRQIDVHVQVDLPEPVRAHLADAEQARAAEAQARSRAATDVRKAAQELVSAGLPLRDVGHVLGVSYQRAHQLAKSA